MSRFLSRLIADESGQDLVEYALLATFIGFAAVAVFDVLRAAIGTVYGTWNTSTNDLWVTPDPGATEP